MPRNNDKMLDMYWYDRAGNKVVKPDGSAHHVALMNEAGTGLVHPVTGYEAPVQIGYLYCKPATYTEVPTATPTVIPFGGNIISDNLGVMNASTHTVTFPPEVITFDYSIGVEMANTTSTYGNVTGARSITFAPALYGMGVINGAPALTGASAGNGIIRACGIGVDLTSVDLLDRAITASFVQNSGSTIRIGDSTGTGAAQTFLILRMYGKR